MKKLLSIPFAVILFTALFFYAAHRPNPKIDGAHNAWYVSETESETAGSPISPTRHLNKEKLLKLLTERIAYFDAVASEKKKIHIDEIALKTEVLKEKPDQNQIALLTGELSSLTQDLNHKNRVHDKKLHEIMNIDSKGFIGRGPLNISHPAVPLIVSMK